MNDPVQNPFMTPGAPDDTQRGGSDSLIGSARTGQIITFAMAQGLLVMTAILTYMNLQGGTNTQPVGMWPGPGGDILLPAVGVLMAVGAWVAATIVPARMRRNAASRLKAKGETVDLPVHADVTITPAVGEFLGASQSATIVGQALLEGAATVNLILMLLDGRLFYLALVAICLIGIVLLTPTAGKLQVHIENAGR